MLNVGDKNIEMYFIQNGFEIGIILTKKAF
jgi:hypothetical protein